eukprot:TRINITY_DN2821_c1_g1_i10.p1 TRINITY_DN2821_c1_g1~~TRINITY_DN2821_c1_g1_i10.p1  ORF type:complete len:692 (+),score=122.03 TRINITY_DN2821_c1_g1_i10:151-2226(+)
MIEELEQFIQGLKVKISSQGDMVRAQKANLKNGNAVKNDVEEAIQLLQQLKTQLEDKETQLERLTGIPRNKEAFRERLLNVLEKKMFFMPSFKIYGGVAGFYDFGPTGCAVKQNITQMWRRHFVIEEGMLELECPAVTPYQVLKASGHVDRFTDFMVKDVKTLEPYRADHLLEDHLESLINDNKNTPSPERKTELENILARVGEMKGEDLQKYIQEFKIKAPDTGNDLSEPYPFNLMFETQIGPRGDLVGYLRPETAQGIFVNFRELLYFNGNKLPFAAAQIGNSYRNEISPRAGLLRVREFTQAEIEHFVHPDHKDHPKFSQVADIEPLLYSRELQLGKSKRPKAVKLGEAVSAGMIANETLAYFIGRTYLFLLDIGINPSRMRFRQHLQHEMAHYAEDCWDAEVECTYGWVEVAGLADRSAFDLRAHTQGSKVELTAYEKYDEPREEEVLVITPNKKELGMQFKKNAQNISVHLENMCEGDAMDMKAKLEAGENVTIKTQCGEDTQEFTLTPTMVKIYKEMQKKTGQNYVPSVIEPSFGLGRVMYCMFEHVFHTREKDTERTLLRFKPAVAPVKAFVFPLIQKEEFDNVAREVSGNLTKEGLYCRIDTTGTTIGKRYARTDEIGVPFAITVDGTTLEDGTVTLRESFTMAQIRVPKSEVALLVRRLVDGETSWKEVRPQYPQQHVNEEE